MHDVDTRSEAICRLVELGLKVKNVTFKLSVWASTIFLVATSPSVAAVEQCRQIKVKADREACYQRQSKPLADKRKAAGADKATIDPVDQLRIENDAVSKRLRGICRGC